jgi:hypothetical protein
VEVYRAWASARERVRTRRGRTLDLLAWGWARESMEEAHALARERVAAAAARARAGVRLDRYAYGRGPLREEVLDELVVGGATVAVVTRNRYGALVLNTDGVLVADLDLPPRPRRGLLDRLLRRGGDEPGEEAARAAAEAAVIDRVREWAAQHPDVRVRTYRTRAGFRALVAGRPLPPASTEAAQVLAALGTDRLYVELCRQYRCYRARLTPKPWRIGVGRSRAWPPETAAAARARERWVRAYDRAREGWAACVLVDEAGSGTLDVVAAAVVALHDRSASREGAPLA